ncbi:MAG: DUF3617 family protein [Sphingomonadales bacterium]|nr:DUF3617 family protein [Sphingomonadales bacterium]
MKSAIRIMALLAILPATTALCMDTAPHFEHGEWQIEMSQGGSATYKDSKNERENGNSSIREDRPKQVGTLCIAEQDAKLLPELFAPACRISNVVYKAKEMKADLYCGNLSMPMKGSLSMTIYKDGKELSGFQILGGGSEQVGALITTQIKMTHMGKCKGK